MQEDINKLLEDIQKRMNKAIAALEAELAKVRVGRAHPSLLDHLDVEYYGSQVPLKQVCNVRVEDAVTLLLEVWEKPMAEVVAKAVAQSDLGLNPAVQGMVVRITMPPMTQERRQEVARVVHRHGESAKVALRNIRRDANQHTKGDLKQKALLEDQEKKLNTDIQKLTDAHVKQVDEIIAAKEKDLMSF